MSILTFSDYDKYIKNVNMILMTSTLISSPSTITFKYNTMSDILKETKKNIKLSINEIAVIDEFNFNDILNSLFNIHSLGYIHGMVKINSIYKQNTDTKTNTNFRNVLGNFNYMYKKSEFTEKVRIKHMRKYFNNIMLELSHFSDFKFDLYCLYILSPSIEFKEDLMKLTYEQIKEKYTHTYNIKIKEVEEVEVEVEEIDKTKNPNRTYLYDNVYNIISILHMKCDSIVLKTDNDMIIKICPRNELNIMKKINIPSLVINKNYYIMPEYEEINPSLDNYIKIINDCLLFLHELHNKNIIHNDIKCPNIMYDKERDYYQLIDFGLATCNNDHGIVKSREYYEYIHNGLGITDKISLGTKFADIYMLCYTIANHKNIFDFDTSNIIDYLNNLSSFNLSYKL